MNQLPPVEQVSTEHWVLPGLGLLLGLAWWLLLRWTGIHMTSDSAGYFMMAYRMDWGQFQSLGQSWPFLYPALMWALNTPLKYPTASASVLSAVSLAMVVGSVGQLTLLSTRGLLLAAVAGLFSGLWGPMLYVFRYAWSEPLYTGFTMLHLVAVAAHLRSRRLRDYSLAAAAAAAAASTRYIGDSLLLVFALYTVHHLLRSRASWQGWLRHAASAALPLVPLLLWLGRNQLRSGTLHGVRSPSTRSLIENVGYFAASLGEQFWATPLLSALLSGALLLLPWHLLRCRQRPSTQLATYTLLYLAAYSGLLLYAATTVAMNRISPRLTMPLMPCALVMALAVYGDLLRELPTQQANWVRGALAMVLVLAGLGGGPALSESMQHISVSINAESGHEMSGFESSETASQLNAMLSSSLRQQPHLVVTVMTQVRSGHKGLGMWTRSAVLEGSGLSLVGYRGYRQKRFLIDLELAGEPRALTAWLHQSLQSPSDVARELREMSNSTGEQELLVLTRSRLLKQIGLPESDLARLPDPRVSCTEQQPIAPYRVYRCTL